jgi:hypothetical protein
MPKRSAFLAKALTISLMWTACKRHAVLLVDGASRQMVGSAIGRGWTLFGTDHSRMFSRS